VKCSGKLLVTVLGIALFSSVGFGAVLDVDGNVNTAHYDITFTDTDIPGEPFAGTGLDIDTVSWGVAPGASPADSWYTLGMTVVAPPINTTGDGSLGPLSRTSAVLTLSQGGSDKYLIQATMLAGTVLDVLMVDISGPTPAIVPLTAPTDLQYKVDNGLELAIKASKFANLSPVSPFDFNLLFEGGGIIRDDIITGRVPEPATMSMLAVGGLIGLARRRKRRNG